MRRLHLAVVFVFAIAACSRAAMAGSDTPDPKKPGVAADAEKARAGDKAMEEMMAAWAKVAQPGEFHEYLKPMAGEWTVACKFRMGPDQPWTESTSESHNKWILGGRFLIQKVKGEPFPPMTEPFEGFGMLGYDNYQKKYVSMWTDTMCTMIMTAEGTCDSSGKTISLTSHYPDPMSGQEKRMRSVYRVQSNDRHTLEMYEIGPDGKEFKGGELVFTKKSGA